MGKLSFEIETTATAVSNKVLTTDDLVACFEALIGQMTENQLVAALDRSCYDLTLNSAFTRSRISGPGRKAST